MAAATDSLTLLTSAPEEVAASAIVALLEEHGIKAIATGGTTAGFRAEAPGWVQVLVADKDYARASTIVERQRHTKVRVDWDQADIGEPVDVGVERSSHLLQSKFWRYLAVVFILIIAIGLLK